LTFALKTGLTTINHTPLLCEHSKGHSEILYIPSAENISRLTSKFEWMALYICEVCL